MCMCAFVFIFTISFLREKKLLLGKGIHFSESKRKQEKWGIGENTQRVGAYTWCVGALDSIPGTALTPPQQLPYKDTSQR